MPPCLSLLHQQQHPGHTFVAQSLHGAFCMTRDRSLECVHTSHVQISSFDILTEGTQNLWVVQVLLIL